MRSIINGKAILADTNENFYIRENAHILFDKKILQIFYGEIPTEILNLPKENIFDAKNKYISPGFINIHAHGAAGADAMDENDDALKIFAQAEAKMGVTSFLPTTMTYDMPRIRRALAGISKAMKNLQSGARILGAHMEGPFISKARCGAQAVDNIKAADFKDIADFTGVIKIITLAPEVASGEFITKANDAGIVLSLGHSDATYEEAIAAIKSGVRHVTHLYNAMSPFHHRRGGVVGAAFDTSVKTEIIADNIHTSPTAQRMAHKIKGIENIILITDSLRASMLGDGESELGGQKVFVKGNEALLEDGTLAGSVAPMNSIIRNFMENTGESLENVIATVTKNPAQSLAVYDKIGSIRAGKFADLTIFDENLEIALTFVEGERR